MDMPVNKFKRAINEGRTQLGAWLVSGAPSTAEALGCAGFDFLVVDMEHTPVDTPEMVEILRTLAGTPAQAVVRLVWNDMVWLKRVLDGGAQTVLLPFVQNAEEAKRAVACTRYPPDGIRGVAGDHRGSRFGTVPDYLKTAAQELCVMVQIETHDGAANSFPPSPRCPAWIRSSSVPPTWRRRWDCWATSATRPCRKSSRTPRNSAGNWASPAASSA